MRQKIACLGGGSLYFPRALADLALTEDLADSDVVLYDIEVEKAEMMARLGQDIAAKVGSSVQFRASVSLEDTVDGADFALTSIGGSGADISDSVYASYHHSADVHIPAKYGIHQVIGDTCGPAGMMMGLRSVPAYLEICREMERRCPDVIVLNHSNPMGVICRAMNKYTSLRFIGICHGVQCGFGHIGEILSVPPQELECTWIGTNHYYWFTRILHQGVDVYPEVMKRLADRQDEPGRTLSNRLSSIYGYKIVYPEDDHIIEFYSYATQCHSPKEARERSASSFEEVPGPVAEPHARRCQPAQDDLPYGLKQKALEHGYDASKPMVEKTTPTDETRRAFFKNYEQILDDFPMPETRDNTVTGEGIAAMISAMAHGRREVCIVNVPNNGIVTNLPATAVLEVEGVTDSKGVRGIQVGECPLVLKGILEKRFVWQELVADAAVKGDRNAALQAVLVDEMSIVPEKAEAMLDELLDASKDLLPQFE